MKPMCVDPRNGDVYVFGDDDTGPGSAVMVRWIRSTNTWSAAVSVPSLGSAFRSASACWNLRRDEIVLVSGMRMRVYDPAGHVMSSVALNGITTPSQNDANFQGNSSVYVPSL